VAAPVAAAVLPPPPPPAAPPAPTAAAPPAPAAAASSSSDEGDYAPTTLHAPPPKRTAADCPYLATVSRAALDFDFEKCCSVTLGRVNVYCCLVCGRYLAGRVPSSPAHTHALEAGHHVFMRLADGKVRREGGSEKRREGAALHPSLFSSTS